MAALTHLFAYAPIVRGFTMILVAGALFPVNGVFVLRLNLITFRFMLMHGTLLGGAIALVLGLDPLFMGVATDLLLVAVIASVARSSGINTGHITSFFMVLTIGLAFAIVYRFNVPAKDALQILWGNIFALTPFDMLLMGLFAVAAVIAVIVLYRKLIALLFSPEIAYTSGVNERALTNFLLVLTGLTIAFSMKLIGALLLDSLLLLPAIVASFFARSMRGTFFLASLIGLASSLIGFFVSVGLDIPASSGVTLVSASILGAGLLVRRLRT